MDTIRAVPARRIAGVYRLAVAATALLCLSFLAAALGACGDIRPSAAAAAAGGYSKLDGDADADDSRNGRTKVKNDEAGMLAAYGPPAGRSETLAVASVVKRYYAAQAGGDARGVCAMLTKGLAAGLSGEGKSAAGTPACEHAMSAQIERQHSQLQAQAVATMTVVGVRAKGRLALAVLGFRSAPQETILLEREGAAWKVDSLFGNNLT
jgi:hypothetical protein